MEIEEIAAVDLANILHPTAGRKTAENGELLEPHASIYPYDVKLDYGDVLLVPGTATSVASRKDVDLCSSVEFSGQEQVRYEGVPVMAANMDGVGSLAMARALAEHRIFTCLAKTHTTSALVEFFRSDERLRDYSAVTIGLRPENIQVFREVSDALGGLGYACLDVANGHTMRFVEFVGRFRKEFPNTVIIAGNVATPEQTSFLAEAGADLIKVGIGAGSVCETRIKTGVGYPQLSAVLECAAAARAVDAKIVADGGCTCPGDVAKALAAGASFVMLGGMFAGHREGGGKIVASRFASGEVDAEGRPVIRERRFVQFYGMSSQLANEKHFDGLKPWKTSEGREVLLPFKPSLRDTLRDLLGGLRSTCTYVGAKSISKLPERARFVRCHDTHNRVFENM